MKISIDIDCTPGEARDFLGLPDVKPLQDNLMRQMQDRIGAGLQAIDPEVLMRTWMPAGIQGFEQLQKLVWSQMAAALGKDGKS